MWKQVRRSLLLGALLVAAAAQAQNAASGSAADVLVSMSVNVDGSLRDLQLMRGESVEAAATSFARTNGLMNQDDGRVRDVIDQLSGLLKGKMAEIEASAPPTQKAAAPAVQLSFPITVDGYTGEVRKHEGESVDAAVERFLYETGFTMDVMRELFPQIVALVNQKLAELQLARKELFAFELTIDNTPAVVRHFDGGSPTEEAIATLRSIGIADGELMDRLVPQLANEITRQIDARAPQPAAGAAGAAVPESPRAAPRELFSIPLTMNDRPAVLVHSEGMTTRESALRFLNDNGVTDPAAISSFLPQLMEILDTRMSEYIRDEAAAAATAPAAAPPASAPARTPLVSLDVNLGENRSANLEYFDGDSVERTVELFLQNVGLGDSPSFAAAVAQLTDTLNQRITVARQDNAALRQQQEQQAQAQAQAEELERQRQRDVDAQAAVNRGAPRLAVPVTLSSKVFTLEYFDGQEVGYVANTFCVEKHELVRAELGIDFDGNQLQECRNVLERTLTDLLAQQQQQPSPSAQDSQATTAAAARGDLLFTLDIDDGEGGSYQLPFYRNDNVEATATAFCQRHGLDLSNVPALVQGIQAQLAQR